MTMAEKQYKNYDERFLKEDTSSSTRSMISYTAPNPDEILNQAGNMMYFKAKFEDGSYCQTSEDLLNLYRSGFIFALEEPGVYTIYSNQMILMFSDYEASYAIVVTIDSSSNPLTCACMVTAPAFEQLKQSVS